MSELILNDVLSMVKNLPDIIQREIFLLYINDYLKNRQLKNFSKDYDMICLFYDKLTSKGFIKIEISDLKYIKMKFPNISLNAEIDKKYLRNLIGDFWYRNSKYLNYKPTDDNIFLAGGFFTNYVSNLFSIEFREYYENFLFKKDVDIFYNHGHIFKKIYDYTGNNYFYFKNKKYNLISLNNSFEHMDTFDYDCCKMSYSYDDNELYVHNSLIFKHVSMNKPSFFNISQIVRVKGYCICIRFKRALKYFMKGFYDEDTLSSELKRAHEIENIFRKENFCKFCENHLFQI